MIRRYEVTYYRYRRLVREGHFGEEKLGEFVDQRTQPVDAYMAQDAMFQVEIQARGSAHIHRVVRVEPDALHAQTFKAMHADL